MLRYTALARPSSTTLAFAAARILPVLAVWSSPWLAIAEPMSDDDCMACHEDTEDVVELADGSKLPVVVDAAEWKASVHHGKIRCADCHVGIAEEPHPEPTAGSLRAYRIQQSETCRRCHYAHYTRVVDGIHFAQLQSGNQGAPTCTDCHGAHGIRSKAASRATVDGRCGRCHAEISRTYEASVHGRGLRDGKADVPVCTDCHGAHAISDPRTPRFHAASYEICARCHGDAERMAPYGLSAAVVSTYLDDFHGASNKLYGEAGAPGEPMATCTDCHGVHDIKPFEGEGDTEAVRQRVLEVCRKCHSDAPPSFADAWLMHHEPTLASAPLVWAVVWAYRILIPFVLFGLLVHIMLHLWRVRLNRRAKR